MNPRSSGQRSGQRSGKKGRLARNRVTRPGSPVTSDPIADMLTRIRNAAMARHTDVNVPVSKVKLEIASILHREGYIRGFQLIDRGRQLRLRLKYDDQKRSVIQGLRRVSKPGRRIYVGQAQLPRVMGGLGVAIVSTSQGVMTAREAASKHTGGEVLGYIW